MSIDKMENVKLNMAQMTEFVKKKKIEETIGGKAGNAGYLNFLLFPTFFFKSLFYINSKLSDWYKKSLCI